MLLVFTTQHQLVTPKQYAVTSQKLLDKKIGLISVMLKTMISQALML